MPEYNYTCDGNPSHTQVISHTMENSEEGKMCYHPMGSNVCTATLHRDFHPVRLVGGNKGSWNADAPNQ